MLFSFDVNMASTTCLKDKHVYNDKLNACKIYNLKLLTIGNKFSKLSVSKIKPVCVLGPDPNRLITLNKYKPRPIN